MCTGRGVVRHHADACRGIKDFPCMNEAKVWSIPEHSCGYAGVLKAHRGGVATAIKAVQRPRVFVCTQCEKILIYFSAVNKQF